MTLRQLQFLPLLMLVSACHGDDSAERGSVEVRDSAGVRIVLSRQPLEAGDWQISEQPALTLQTDDDGDWVIHWIRGARHLSDGRIVLLSESARQLLFFNENGDYLTSAAREGDGPGELGRPFLLDLLAGDTLVVTDRRTGLQTWFSGTGEYVKNIATDRTPLQEVVPNTHSVGFPQFLAPGFVLAEANARGLPEAGRRVRRTKYYVLGGAALSSPRRIGPFGSLEQFSLSERIGRWAFFATNTVLASGGSPPRFYVGDSALGEIWVYDLDGQLRQVVRDAEPPPSITDRDIEWERWELLDWGEQSGQLEELTRLADAMPLPDEKPAFESILVDRLGFLWVKEYSSYRPDPVAYRIYDPSGARVGVVALPGRLTVFDIGADYILGVYADTDYVESILEYRLTRP